MMTVQVEVDSRRLGRTSLLIPFKVVWLASHTCREMLQQVLTENLNGVDVLENAEQITLFVSKRQDNTTDSGPCRSSVANATTCMDFTVLVVMEAFSALYFAFKIVAKSNASTSQQSLINTFEFLKRTQVQFVSLPPPLSYARMYANHDTYNDLRAFLEKHELGWTVDTAKTDGHRFIDAMSKAFFQCTPATWSALNDKHNSGAFPCFLAALPSLHFYDCISIQMLISFSFISFFLLYKLYQQRVSM